MKLLNDERIEKKQGDIALVMRPVTTSEQAHIMSLYQSGSVESRVLLTVYALSNFVEKLSVLGVPYVPSELSVRADLADKETVKSFMAIGSVVLSAVFPSDADKKK